MDAGVLGGRRTSIGVGVVLVILGGLLTEGFLAATCSICCSHAGQQVAVLTDGPVCVARLISRPERLHAVDRQPRILCLFSLPYTARAVSQ